MKYRNRLKEDIQELRNQTNRRTLNKTKKFIGQQVPAEAINRCFEFAYNMANNTFHRENRSGGKYKRTQLEIFWDTFSGKISEYVAYLYFKNSNATVNELDFNIYPRGRWDSFDMTVNGKIISIKSTKHFGQLLLLETSDWNTSGQYIPNTTTNHNSIKYDYFMLVRTKIEYDQSIRKGPLPTKETLSAQVSLLDIQGEITGILSHYDFVNQIIKFKYIIYQGQLLQGRIPMDATNYYVHAADLESPDILLS